MEGKYKVVAEQVRNTRTPGVIDLRPVAFMADAPYKAGLWRGEEDQYADVRDYLATLKKNNPDLTIRYRFAWWRQTWAIYLLWTGTSLLLIGGVWPSVISLMVGAGLGFNKEDSGPAYDLDRFKGEATAVPGARREPTAEELERLHRLEDELEKRLEAERLGIPMPEDQPAVAATAAPRQLNGGPLEAATANNPAEEHDYKGEFYPVDRHVNKKHE
jgi:hypothetical protein